MDRSRSKRSYNYYDNQDYNNPEQFPRTRPRFYNHNNFNDNFNHNNNNYSFPAHHHYPNSRHRNVGGAVGDGRMGGKTVDETKMVSTSYKLLCDHMKVGGIIGKSGNVIKSIRQRTGTWINVHELVEGDDERIIEISDARRRDYDGRMMGFSPAQEALFLVHERVVESELFGDEEGGRGGVGNGKVVTRLVVSKMHIGSLMGKGGKIIEQMRMETRSHIRILPRDHTLPRCVAMGEEVVQIAGDVNAVKNAISNISSRLRESQHRDRGNLQGRHHSDDRSDDDLAPHINNASRRDGPPYNSQLSNSYNKRNNNASRSCGYAPRSQNGQNSFEDLVFRVLCPTERVDSVVGESNGIMDLLQKDIGVVVNVSGPVDGSEERIITISSDEGPEDELFPAQEALLHIQTRIVDLVPGKDNIVTTRLLIASRETRCFDEDGSLAEAKKLTGADIEILPKEKVPSFLTANDSLIQIVGEIKVAREALVEVTAKLRSYLYKEFTERDKLPPSDSAPPQGNSLPEPESVNNPPAATDSLADGSPALVSQGDKSVQPPKDAGFSSSETSKHNETDRREDSASSRRDDIPTTLNRIQIPMVTRSTLEVVIPEYAVTRLLAKSKNKLGQISELSGAKVTLVEDEPDSSEKIIRMSGTREQAERAQSLLQGFFLSVQEDGP